ncbi:metalloprotease [Pseudoalteromonas luteoviolacea]|uniref:Metalloprotease n=1 Tax=Pseudoalteromonas luteoviolacea TaxID=43657 RepID=A0A1C0TN60_9GAMM|nr:site-2 protease family protein [Pseudoalteromonas luteoviolacea]MBQ4812156.1 site-2 protease family protein [Pseudoalteromonas luteoviolacea]OCQ20278.1 metalloprotease [Pseudoalteromonas luteoviolacea]
MIRIELPIDGMTISVMVNRQSVVQVYKEQQSMPIDELNEHQLEVDLGQRTLQISTEQLRDNLLAVSIDQSPWQWVEVPVASYERKGNWLGLAALGFKLFKSAKVIKAALIGASVAGYAWLFSWQFALMLVACLVVHEYGHVRAMKYFGLKTKGFYLIPFVGGLAMSEDKMTTRWQDVIISLMGPAFGLFTSVLGVVLYYVTGSEIFAGVAVLSALLNLFNLLPILPLDGGHVLKSISFSMRSWVGLLACLGGLALGLWVSYTFGLMLLAFFIFIGSIEILLEWRTRHQTHLLPLDRYGQIVSAALYVLVAVGHIAVMWHFADSDNVILSLPVKVLSS